MVGSVKSDAGEALVAVLAFTVGGPGVGRALAVGVSSNTPARSNETTVMEPMITTIRIPKKILDLVDLLFEVEVVV